MDLTDVMKEASIVDHDWQVEGLLQPGNLTFDPKAEGIKKRNNIKPELEVEWGNAGPNVDLNEPAGVVERNIPDNTGAIVNDVIIFARDQMNRGRMGKSLVSSLKAKFDSKTLRSAEKRLKNLFALEGIIGCIAVDGRGYSNCQEALKVASGSPYKRFIKYIIGCQCGDPHFIPVGEGTALGPIVPSSGNPVDDFLASKSPRKMSMVSHCRSTMMPIMAWDLDDSMADETMIDIQSMTDMPEDQYNGLIAARKSGKISSNILMIRKAFRTLSANKERLASKKYSDFVDNSEYIINPFDNELQIDNILDQNIEIDEQTMPNEIENSDVAGFESLDVEMDQFMEDEFQGTGEFDINEEIPANGALDVRMIQDMTF